MCNKIPHVHSELIKAWADGAKIQIRGEDSGIWYDCSPTWGPYNQYRITPEPKPDIVSNIVVKFAHSWKTPIIQCSWEGNVCPPGYMHNLDIKQFYHIQFTFDGETDNLKSVEIIK